MRRLGGLERAVMDAVWASEAPVSGRDVVRVLNQDRQLADTTVLTTMDRLVAKGILTRQRAGRRYVYSPVQSPAAYAAGLMAEVLGDAEDQRAVLLHFVGQMPSSSTRHLHELLSAHGAPREDDSS